jgi:uncharacterized protein
MTVDCVLDTNILVRHFIQDDAALSPRATALFREVANGSLTVLLPDAIVFETVFTLERPYKVTRKSIADVLLGILELKQIVSPGRETFREVFDLYVGQPSLSFVDCYLAVVATREGINCVATFDNKLSNLLGIRRMAPPDAIAQ